MNISHLFIYLPSLDIIYFDPADTISQLISSWGIITYKTYPIYKSICFVIGKSIIDVNLSINFYFWVLVFRIFMIEDIIMFHLQIIKN